MTAPTAASPAPPFGHSRPSRLREAHAHLAALGREMAFVALDDASSGDDALQRLARHARETPDDWVIGVGARPEAWPERAWPPAAAFDAALGARPSIIRCFDHHALLANSAALARAHISARTPDPAGGVIARTPSGEPTGLLLEHAAHLVWSHVPEPDSDARRTHLRRAIAHLASLGFTEVHDLLSQPWLGPELARLHDAGELTLAVRLYPLAPDLPAVAASAPGWQRPGLSLAGAKIFADGTLNSRTAWMLHPYADPAPGLERGKPMMTPDDLRAAISRADALGLPIAAHAIGDAAVRAVLDAIEAVRPRARGARIEHAEIIDEADVPRFAALGVTCSVQPCHLLYDIEALTRALPHRLHRVLPLRDLLGAGLTPGQTLLFGSDVPIVRADPLDSIQAAVRRARSSGGPRIAPAQALSESEAWQCFVHSDGP
ncbi:MAG: amidohydrolase family protein [Phycisphaerales bacterium]|nr:amidohydrolase family protein [Phycisphaerales bacterium]